MLWDLKALRSVLIVNIMMKFNPVSVGLAKSLLISKNSHVRLHISTWRKFNGKSLDGLSSSFKVQ